MPLVKSADRVMRILEKVGRHKDGLTQKEISERLQIPKSSLHAILSDMTDHEYLTHDNLTKRFVLGPKVLILAGRYLENQDVVGQGRPLVSKLSRETGETGVLAIPVGWDALVVYKEDCLQPILPSIQVGTRFPFYASAAGKAILAHYTDREANRYLRSVKLSRITAHTVTNPKQLLSELKAIRKGALAYNREGFREGITAIAAPVFNHNGQVVASISISALTRSLTSNKEKQYEGIITKITTRFSKLLGYFPRS